MIKWLQFHWKLRSGWSKINKERVEEKGECKIQCKINESSVVEKFAGHEHKHSFGGQVCRSIVLTQIYVSLRMSSVLPPRQPSKSCICDLCVPSIFVSRLSTWKGAHYDRKGGQIEVGGTGTSETGRSDRTGQDRSSRADETKNR